jgi:PAS domain S-box-containing protein
MDAPLTILVVDDTEATRYTLTRILRAEGFVVHEAATGEDALREAKLRPDLVILDVRLPDANGYDICRRLKADSKTAGIPVLHLSATFADSESRSEGLEQGADGYLTYPVERRELVATVRSILRARRAERLAREQSELLRVTLASIGDAVIATDVDGQITFLNTVAETLTGWDARAAVGMPIDRIYRILQEGTRQPAAGPADRISGNGAAGSKNQFMLIARDGAERPIEDSADPIRDADGNVVGIVVVFRDIAERRRAESALLESNRHKDEFLAMLAHELRNPLAPIRSAIQVLRIIGSQEPPAEEARALIERQVEQLARLVDDLLDVSRITRGLIRLKKEVVDVSTIVSGAVESSRPLIDARRHALRVELPDEALLVEADRVRLAQVLMNLLNNAAKYTPEGGSIALTVKRIGDAPGQVSIKVRDSGMGIPAEMLPRVFDLFTQAERTLDRAEGGLGIGLTLVRRLMELHGGTVRVSSPGPGQGSEFVIQLPVTERSAVEPQGPARTSERRSQSRRILVVDDNRDSADSLATLLRLFGNDVRTSYNGRQALAVAAIYRPDLVLLDLGLPGMDGFEVARQMRSLPDQGGTLIVAMTGYGTEEDRRQTSAAGFNAHLVKPVDIETLQELLSSPELMSNAPTTPA